MPIPRSPRPPRGVSPLFNDRHKLKVQFAEALDLLGRLVDHQDDPCEFDHHGTCRMHSAASGEPGTCAVAQARAWLAEHRPAPPATGPAPAGQVEP